MNVFFGLLQTGKETVGAAHWGHIGGFTTGVIFAEAYKASSGNSAIFRPFPKSRYLFLF